jgi:hypothetical protein
MTKVEQEVFTTIIKNTSGDTWTSLDKFHDLAFTKAVLLLGLEGYLLTNRAEALAKIEEQTPALICGKHLYKFVPGPQILQCKCGEVMK